MSELLRRGRASTRSASPRPGARAGRWPSGSSRASRASTSRRSTSGGSPPFNGNNQWLHDRVARSSACTTRCPGRTARSRPPGRSAAPRSTTCCARPTPTSAAEMGWERANFFAPAGSDPASSTPGASRTGCPGRRPSSAPPATRWRVFDQTSFSKYLLDRPGRGAGAAVAVHRGRCRRAGPDRLHRHAQRPRHLRVRRHRHPAAADEFLLVSSAATTERDKDHIRRHIPPGAQRRPRRRHLVATRSSA